MFRKIPVSDRTNTFQRTVIVQSHAHGKDSFKVQDRSMELIGKMQKKEKKRLLIKFQMSFCN